MWKRFLRIWNKLTSLSISADLISASYMWISLRENVPSDICAKWTQISLRIRVIGSESSLSAWKNMASLAIQKCTSEDWSNYVNAQTDMILRWVHMSDGTLSDVAIHTIPLLIHLDGQACHVQCTGQYIGQRTVDRPCDLTSLRLLTWIVRICQHLSITEFVSKDFVR